MVDANTDLKSLLGIWPATVQALSLSYATDAELFAALGLCSTASVRLCR
jgi:hypothetical protein